MQCTVEARASTEEVDILHLQVVLAYSKQWFKGVGSLRGVSYLAHAYPLHSD